MQNYVNDLRVTELTELFLQRKSDDGKISGSINKKFPSSRRKSGECASRVLAGDVSFEEST